MEKKNVMFLAIFGALLVGCSEEEIANVETSSQNAISFNVVSNAAETKATPITPDNLTTTDFDVFAYTADGTAFMGKDDVVMGNSGVKIEHNGTKWDYADQSDVHYWPATESLNFYAISPGSYSVDYVYHYMWNFNHEMQKIEYACMDEYGNGEGKHADHDVMYGIALNQTKGTNNGVVKFTFKHILSQVVFKARTELATMNVTISSIKICNAKMSGTFTLPSDAKTVPTTADNWVLKEGGAYSPTVIRNAAIEVKSNTEATDISSKTPIFVIPQTLTKWVVADDTKTIDNAKNAGQSYLEISCKIQQAGVYLYGSADEYKTIYVPFEASWEPGKRYIYTMIFGGGYDENGDEILKPIEFEAETEDWVDDAGNDHEVNM
ncbi:fimbrillin family protein [Parabacteroides massiliensis]|uniref:fimbrillin family protein n=1 Tax=Parabacteroides massiliensis TaxID=1750560 RepID=UPI00096A9FCD|nr:fimbrillin family protein [Parabacteroides massiliensis]